ncbi:MAG: NUDIX hydrolase [Candidatus Nanopelagicales bacterium]
MTQPSHQASSAGRPSWVADLVSGVVQAESDQLSRLRPPAGLVTRASAVLILFGQAPGGPDVLLIERAAELRSHAGQPAFPGGGIDAEDAGPTAAALREAQEETDVDPAGVEVLAELPALWVPPSGYAVTPVLAWWPRPNPVRVVDTGEVAKVARVPVSELTDPANRVLAVHPSGYVGPGFLVADMLVWGFTGGLLDRILELTGWARPWPAPRKVDL